jgi:hypothetical protein
MLLIGLVAEGRGPRSSPPTPKYLAPPSRRAGPPCFAPQAVLTALDQEQELGGTKRSNAKPKRIGQMTRTHSLPRERWGEK